MSTVVAGQLRRDQALARRLAAPWRELVVLERLARGGGATRWFFARPPEMVEPILERLSPGSSVSFYFANHLRVELDTEAVRQRMFDELDRAGELVVGYPDETAVELEIEIISGPSELTGFLMQHPEGSLAVWGSWPARANDGQDAITLDLVDADGVLRQHPH
jgi:hypothetical protein